MVPGSPGKTPLRNILPADERSARVKYLYIVDWLAEGVEASEGHDVAAHVEGGAALSGRVHLPSVTAPLPGLNNNEERKEVKAKEIDYCCQLIWLHGWLRESKKGGRTGGDSSPMGSA